MLFHMEEDEKGVLIGWVLPDNPSAIPIIKISTPDGNIVEVEANAMRTDLRDRGLHETGMVGFFLNESTRPDIMPISDQTEIRELQTNVLIFRRFKTDTHSEQKILRFDLQAMPDIQIERLFAEHFTYPYGAIQRFPQDTMFGIINNPMAKSIYLSGRPNLQQYEQLLREREFKIVALIRNPYEEMAERLLFARYASNPDLPSFIADNMFGLEPLMDFAKNIKFDDINSIVAAFSAMTDMQKRVLANPLVRALACLPDEVPKVGHVEIALSKLSRMELVGLRSRFDDFKSILHEILGVDVLGEHELNNLAWVKRVVEHLSQIKQARALISLDLDLYSYVDEAVVEAIGPAPSTSSPA